MKGGKESLSLLAIWLFMYLKSILLKKVCIPLWYLLWWLHSYKTDGRCHFMFVKEESRIHSVVTCCYMSLCYQCVMSHAYIMYTVLDAEKCLNSVACWNWIYFYSGNSFKIVYLIILSESWYPKCFTVWYLWVKVKVWCVYHVPEWNFR